MADAVFAGLLGVVHGFIGALDGAGLIVVHAGGRDAGAEGDEHLVVAGRKNFW